MVGVCRLQHPNGIILDGVGDGDAARNLLHVEDVLAADHRLDVHVVLRRRAFDDGVQLLASGEWDLELEEESIELGFGLSPAVERAVPALIDLVMKETAALGFAFEEAA